MLLPNEMQISCRPYMARAHTNRRFLIAASDGAARTGPRAIRPVGCMRGLGHTLSEVQGAVSVTAMPPGSSQQLVSSLNQSSGT